MKTIYRDEYTRLVVLIRARREVVGLNQTQVARALGWSQQVYAGMEAGARRLDVFEYFVLTERLGLSIEEAVAMLRSTIVRLPGEDA